MNNSFKISVIGLGYVGLPLAVALSKKHTVIGYDVSNERITQLKNSIDVTLEIPQNELKQTNIFFTNNSENISGSDIYIVTVPTPIDDQYQPDLKSITMASEMVGKLLEKDNIVVYESTVFPGCTLEFCKPILEEHSNLKHGTDFYLGYSPERINPGDKVHTVERITKVVSGCCMHSLEIIDEMYSSVIKAGTFRAESITVAETAKVIENAQRDINIAFVNEIAKFCAAMGVPSRSVFDAASTKWNFLDFRPGLVGGHCIGVDPYYLTWKAAKIGAPTNVTLSGRETNESMPTWIAQNVADQLQADPSHQATKILILGLTFKEDCPDTRNSKVITLVNNLLDRGFVIDIYDPFITKNNNNIVERAKLLTELSCDRYAAIIIAVGHTYFRTLGLESIKALSSEDAKIFDLKSLFAWSEVNFQL